MVKFIIIDHSIPKKGTDVNCNMTYQITELKNVEHLKIPSSFAPFKFGNIFPETINTRQGHKPFRIDLPCVPV